MKGISIPLAHFFALALTVMPCKNPQVLTERMNGSSAEVAAGDCLEISLHGNPTTGFAWEVAAGAESILAAQGEPRFSADNSALGAGGVYTFTFVAVAAGEAPLELVYRRPWETNLAPLKTFSVKVTVTGGRKRHR